MIPMRRFVRALNARAITSGLADALAATFVVDNRPGAGGALGTEIVAQAKPDGYTLLVSSTGSLTNAPIVFPKLRYEPARGSSAVPVSGARAPPRDPGLSRSATC